MHWGARLLCSQKPFPCILLTPLALSERSGKLLISGGNGRFDVALCCGLAAEPAQSDKHLAAVSCLLFLAQRAIRCLCCKGLVFALNISFQSFGTLTPLWLENSAFGCYFKQDFRSIFLQNSQLIGSKQTKNTPFARKAANSKCRRNSEELYIQKAVRNFDLLTNFITIYKPDSCFCIILLTNKPTDAYNMTSDGTKETWKQWE